MEQWAVLEIESNASYTSGRIVNIHGPFDTLSRARIKASTVSNMPDRCAAVEPWRDDELYPNVSSEGWVKGTMMFTSHNRLPGQLP